MKRVIFPGIFLLLSLIVVSLDIAFFRTVEKANTDTLIATHALGNTDDYHQYIYFIKTGREGSLLQHAIYTELPLPDHLLQPIFHLVGLLSRPFPVSLYTAYFLFHLASLLILFGTIYLLINRVFGKPVTKILAAVLYFTATGYWWFTSLSPVAVKTFQLNDYDFDLFLKFHVIPPHHNIAIALITGMFLSLTSQRKHGAVVAGVLSLVLGLVHPYIQYMGLLMIAVNAIIQSVVERKLITRAAKDAAIVLLWSLPTTLYYFYLYGVVLKMYTATAGIFTFLKRDISWTLYFEAMGPGFLLALPSLLLIKNLRMYSLTRLLVLWAYLPIVLFFLPDIGIPFTVWRLFQIYQHLPFSLLIALWIGNLVKPSGAYAMTAATIGIASLLYGGFIYGWMYKSLSNQSGFQAFFNYYLPKSLHAAYVFLEKNTPRDSVVLASQLVSSMLPTYSHNKVINGHIGNNRDYVVKLGETQAFLSGTMSVPQAKEYLKLRNVSYIIFGFDAPAFSATPYRDAPYLSRIWGTPDGISVVQVNK